MYYFFARSRRVFPFILRVPALALHLKSLKAQSKTGQPVILSDITQRTPPPHQKIYCNHTRSLSYGHPIWSGHIMASSSSSTSHHHHGGRSSRHHGSSSKPKPADVAAEAKKTYIPAIRKMGCYPFYSHLFRAPIDEISFNPSNILVPPSFRKYTQTHRRFYFL